MDLWHGSLSEFSRAATAGSLPGTMTQAFVNAYGALPGSSELASWQASLPAIADTLRPLARAEIGVALQRPHSPAVAVVAETTAGFGASNRGDVGVATEYQLPLSGRRLDVLLCGTELESRRRHALVIELKQWSSVTVEDDVTQNVIVGGREEEHPSQQALDYAQLLSEYHEACTKHDVLASSASYCHNLGDEGTRALRDSRFDALLLKSPMFVSDQSADLVDHVRRCIAGGEGMEVLERVVAGRFAPGRNVLARLEEVIRATSEWTLLDEQRVAYQAILADVRRARAGRGRKCIIVRGAPGTGKTVIAVQLLASALRLQWRAVHSTGGKAFTTVLKSKFSGANALFVGNLDIRKAGKDGLDLALVDEAHRLRKTSDTFRTPKTRRSDKTQIDEIFDTAKVAVFFLDENQFVRPNEIGTVAMIDAAARARGIRPRQYDLSAQFRCGGCAEYVAWIDGLLQFGPAPAAGWGDRFRVRVVDAPSELDEISAAATARGERARTVAGFCWRWSDPRDDGSLVPDVEIGVWTRPWNRKEHPRKHYSPKNHPYTLWAETDEGRGQIGCIYSAQGFEFESVGVIWGLDLVWRGDRWVGQPEHSKDKPVRSSPIDQMTQLARNAYRVLLSRATREVAILCLDEETRAHVTSSLRAVSRSA